MSDVHDAQQPHLVTRRSALTRFLTAVGSVTLVPSGAFAWPTGTDLDPAVAAWREWHLAHEHAVAMCKKQQRLETQLVNLIGFPREPNLAAHKARWKAEDRRIGYTAALRAEGKAFREEKRLSRILFTAETLSFAGVIGKIHALHEMEAPHPSDDVSPWPELRRIRADLSRLVGEQLVQL